MARHVSEYTLPYDYPASERRLMLRGIGEAAERLGRVDVVTRVAAAQAVTDKVIELEHEQAQAESNGAWETSTWSTTMAALDAEIDGSVTACHRVIAAIAEIPSHPYAQASRDCLGASFSKGLGAFTNARYVEQSVYNEELVAHLRGPGKAMAEALGLTESVDQLAAQSERFAAALVRTGLHVDRASAEVADDLSSAATLEVLYYLLSTPHTDTQAITQRDTMLDALLQSNERLSAMYTRRARDGRARAKARREKECEMKETEGQSDSAK